MMILHCKENMLLRYIKVSLGLNKIDNLILGD